MLSGTVVTEIRVGPGLYTNDQGIYGPYDWDVDAHPKGPCPKGRYGGNCKAGNGISNQPATGSKGDDAKAPTSFAACSTSSQDRDDPTHAGGTDMVIRTPTSLMITCFSITQEI